MKTISDLPLDLVGEILVRVPTTCLEAVRCTCKRWNDLSKEKIVCRAESSQQYLGFLMKEFRVCSVRFDLRGIHSSEEFVDPSIKEIGHHIFNKVEISKVFHCNGLLLSVTRDNSSLVVWNPYLGQTKWIQPRKAYTLYDRDYNTYDSYAIGYDNNNGNHKILRFFNEYIDKIRRDVAETEVYDLSSNSWSVVDNSPELEIHVDHRGVSLKGNTYFIAREKELHTENKVVQYEVPVTLSFLVCFDFTRERFGEILPLPFLHHMMDTGALSCLRDEKLAALYRDSDSVFINVEIWVTTMIEPNAVSWVPFLKVVSDPFTSPYYDFHDNAGSFFIDEEKKVAVVFHVENCEEVFHREKCAYDEIPCFNSAYIMGQDDYLKVVNLGESQIKGLETMRIGQYTLVCSSSYVPSLVHIHNGNDEQEEAKYITT